jgi:hypothetical protein
MGLDQSFYKVKDTDIDQEVLYFRKFWALHDHIGDVLGTPLENGGLYRLQPEDLTKVAEFILANPELYWAYNIEEDDAKDLPDAMFAVVGKLFYYAQKGEPLFYSGDW